MLRKSLAIAALAAGVGLSTGCMSSPCERPPLLSRLGLNGRAERRAAEVCSQPMDGPALEDCGPGCASPYPYNGEAGMNGTLTPQPGLPPLGPPPRLVPTPQAPGMPYAPSNGNGY
ncbi:MAG TPA: hypothetical protein VGG61_07545 [Gemmataceae bacterium]